MTTPHQITIGMAGLGTVGAGVWKHLAANRDLLQNRLGAEFILKKIAVRRPERAQQVGVPAEMTVSKWEELINDDSLDVIIELIGGTKDAYQLIRRALESGKHVITANKALLAEHGDELFRLAAKHRRRLLFEASVAGGIPIVKALREGLVANHIISMHGIINGTCNYILSRMSETGEDYLPVLAQAKSLGYAEADESLDVDGHDTAHKAAVLAALAYGFWVPPDQLYTEGISQVERQDMSYARKLGYELKLLAIIKAEGNAVEVRVHPTLVPLKHVLASVSGVFNAISVRGDVVGDCLFYGRGAGADATASAVIGDLGDLALTDPTPVRMRPVGLETLYPRLKSMDDIVSRYYVRLEVIDQPGVLAQIASIFGKCGVGISSIIQPERPGSETVPLVVMVHDAREAQFNGALQEIAQLEVVKAPPVRLRVEDFE